MKCYIQNAKWKYQSCPKCIPEQAEVVHGRVTSCTVNPGDRQTQRESTRKIQYSRFRVFLHCTCIIDKVVLSFFGNQWFRGIFWTFFSLLSHLLFFLSLSTKLISVQRRVWGVCIESNFHCAPQCQGHRVETLQLVLGMRVFTQSPLKKCTSWFCIGIINKDLTDGQRNKMNSSRFCQKG